MNISTNTPFEHGQSKIVTFLFIFSIAILQSCSKDIEEQYQESDTQKKELFKRNVIALAKQYDVKIDFYDITAKDETSRIFSLKDIEQLFSEIKKSREQPVELSLYRTVKENGIILYRTKERHQFPIKTRGEVYAFSEWIWNLTWFSVTLIEDNKNISVQTSISGFSVYSYNQTYSSGYLNNNTISFSSRGEIKATITSYVGINVSYTVVSSGTFNKSTNNGEVNVSTY